MDYISAKNGQSVFFSTFYSKGYVNMMRILVTLKTICFI